MPDFITLLTQAKQAAAVPPSFEEHKFKAKNDDDESAAEEKKEEKEEKKASAAELADFANQVAKRTEKVAAIVREDNNPAAEQLFRNMISASMHMKFAGLNHEAYAQPDTLIKHAYNLMLNAAATLGLPLE